MQNGAANLGGMLTPVGNPQNLYLYSFFGIGAGEFFAIMAIPFAVAFVLIAGTCLVVKPEPIRLETHAEPAPPVWRMIVYFVLREQHEVDDHSPHGRRGSGVSFEAYLLGLDDKSSAGDEHERHCERDRYDREEFARIVLNKRI